MRSINVRLFIICTILWTAFFCFFDTVTNYWLGVALFMGLIAVTAAYILTLSSSIRIMSAEEDDKEAEHRQQAHDDMQAMDELYNKLLLDEILK